MENHSYADPKYWLCEAMVVNYFKIERIKEFHRGASFFKGTFFQKNKMYLTQKTKPAV